ncbi:hypothetical protein J6590_108433 [Homalodisca vitripennis]|nr:hypothetical protein J6590_108433 [Homalodisca vitripennis]
MMNVDLEVLFKWCSDHGLNLNISKCKPIIFGTQRLLSQLNLENITRVKIDGEDLEYQKSVINLGIRINNSLSWTDQVNYVHKRVYSSLYQFKKLCFNPPVYVKKLLVMSLIFPVFDYSLAAYCDVNNTLITKLQRAQNACVRYIYGLRLDDHVTPFYRDLGWLKIKERIEYNVLTVMYSILKEHKPDYLFENYTRMDQVHARQTRFGNVTLQFPIHRTTTYSNSFHVQSIRNMNTLDDDVKNATSKRLFKEKLRGILLQRYT